MLLPPMQNLHGQSCPTLMAWWLKKKKKKICLPMWETQEIWVQSVGQEDTLEEVMAIGSSILAWKIPWAKEPDRLQSKGPWNWTRLNTQPITSWERLRRKEPPRSVGFQTDFRTDGPGCRTKRSKEEARPRLPSVR